MQHMTCCGSYVACHMKHIIRCVWLMVFTKKVFWESVQAQVCQAISEMSTTLGDLENTFTQKMQAFLAERPQLATHVSGLKEDITGLIKVLSEKLVTSSDVEATIEDEVCCFPEKPVHSMNWLITSFDLYLTLMPTISFFSYFWTHIPFSLSSYFIKWSGFLDCNLEHDVIMEFLRCWERKTVINYTYGHHPRVRE